MSDYPEHEKLRAVKGEAETIGAFLEWLQSEGKVICTWQDAGNNGKPRVVPATPEDIARIAEMHGTHSWEVANARANGVDNFDYEWWGDEYVPMRGSISDRLAEYFHIDQVKLDAEKRAMLEKLRAAN